MRVRFILLLITALMFLQCADAATLHGAIYDSSFNTMTNAQVSVNTTPKQSIISKNGAYFFNVPLGTYKIVVEKYIQKKLVYSAEQIVEVNNDGEFNIDIIVEQLPGVDIPVDPEPGPTPLQWIRARFGLLFYGGLMFLGLVVLGFGLYVLYTFLRKKKNVIHVPISYPESKKDNSEVVYSDPKPALSKDEYDCDEVLRIIKEQGGRATQKDIRRQIPLSEAKVSLMVSELEAKGKIQKLKKGRGNILVVKE